MAKNATDRLLEPLLGNEVLVHDLVRQDAELCIELTPSSFALDDQLFEIADELRVVLGASPRSSWLLIGHHPDTILRHTRP